MDDCDRLLCHVCRVRVLVCDVTHAGFPTANVLVCDVTFAALVLVCDVTHAGFLKYANMLVAMSHSPRLCSLQYHPRQVPGVCEHVLVCDVTFGIQNSGFLQWANVIVCDVTFAALVLVCDVTHAPGEGRSDRYVAPGFRQCEGGSLRCSALGVI